MDAAIRKRHGVHYTPAHLARFLAEQTARHFDSSQRGPIRILDPACGEGELLASLVNALPCPSSQIEVIGIEQDVEAAEIAGQRVLQLDVKSCEIQVGDFLDEFEQHSAGKLIDIVIANPPYVRTQILGGRQAKRLAKRFGLTGRVDLYQVFTVAISRMLNKRGVLGLLTSNRFLTVKAGYKLRQLLTTEFELRDVFDLGDTRLFEAAVLPVIVTATKNQPVSGSRRARFHRVYRTTEPAIDSLRCSSILAAVSDLQASGIVAADEGEDRYLIERGELDVVGDEAVWTMSNQRTRNWLAQVRSRQVATFGEIAAIKVGIKTTADRIFIREDWDSLPAGLQPESSLLRPLITHRDARRWSIAGAPQKTVLYPYSCRTGHRQPIQLNKYSKASAYLKSNRQQLAKRKYLIDSGRQWYEIWVPHRPQDWAIPKIVWPDISQQPKFFFDESGAIVNGDCYWLKMRSNTDPDWIYLMLAVANSSLATTYYDTVFHNKLYAGRRRFMTQYVKDFPLPEKNTTVGKKIIQVVKRLIEKTTPRREEQVEQLLREAFGF